MVAAQCAARSEIVQQAPYPYPPPSSPVARPPRKGNGCLIGGLIAVVALLCVCAAILAGLYVVGWQSLDAAAATATSAAATAALPDDSGDRFAIATATAQPRATARATSAPAAPTAAGALVRTATPAPTPRAGATARPTTAPSGTPGDKQQQEEVFDQFWFTVKDYYVDPKFNGLNWDAERATALGRIRSGISDAQFHALISDLLTRLGDDHSYYLSPEEARIDAARYLGEDTVVEAGVFARPNREKGWLYILRVMPDSPAARAGLRPHDIIRSIDGQPAVTADGRSRSDELGGREGATSRLVVFTPGKADRTVTLTQAKLVADTPIEHRLIPGPRKIGYLNLSTLNENGIGDKVTDALQALMDQSGGNLDGLIIDVRQNNGGTELNLVSTLGLFTNKAPGDFVDRNGNRNPLDVFDLAIGNSQKVKLAILIGKDTASFGEIFAGGLQSARGALLVGQPSAGNIEFLRVFNLRDGSKLALAFQTFRLPNGSNWEGKGLTPNVPVAATWDSFGADDIDPVLQAALTALSR